MCVEWVNVVVWFFSGSVQQSQVVAEKGGVVVEQSQGWGLRVGFTKGGTDKAADKILKYVISKAMMENISVCS